MKKYLIVLILLLTGMAMAYSQTGAVKKENVLLTLWDNKVDTAMYSAAKGEAFQVMAFKSFYNFIGVLPFVEMGDEQALRQIKVDTGKIESLATEQKSKYIIYGNFSFKGDRSEPEVVVNLRVWSMEKKENIFSRTYTAPMDMDILDALDRMMLDVVENIFQIKVKLANVAFRDFRIANEPYRIYANNKLIATATNSRFYLPLKILADTPYHFMVERVKDKAVVVSKNVTLKDGQSDTISYSAFGSFSLGKLKFKERNKTYSILLDGQEIKEEQTVSNLDVSAEHNLIILDGKRVIQFRETYFLKDGEDISLSPAVNWPGSFKMRSYFLGGSIAGFGGDYFLNRKMWLGVNAGFTFTAKSTLTNTINIYAISPSLEFGYYFLGDLAYDWRLGIGVNVGGYIAFPRESWQLIDDSSNFSIVPGIYGTVEWKFIFARLYVYYDIFATNPWAVYPAIGFKF